MQLGLMSYDSVQHYYLVIMVTNPLPLQNLCYKVHLLPQMLLNLHLQPACNHRHANWQRQLEHIGSRKRCLAPPTPYALLQATSRSLEIALQSL